jgi:hypothetical protein
VKDQTGKVLGAGAASFLVTTGDPDKIASIGVSFDGLTEESPAPAPEG